MNRIGKIALGSISLLLAQGVANAVFAQSTISSETTIQTRGVGFKGANIFNPKYKERIGTYKEQIQMGETRGWLTAAEVQAFRARLADMESQESAAAAKGWQKADVDAIDKVFTQFNIDLTKAANKPAQATPSTTPSPVQPSASKPGGTGSKTNTTASGGKPSSNSKTTGKAVAKKTTVKNGAKKND